MSKKSVLRYKKLLTTQVKEKLHAVLLTSTHWGGSRGGSGGSVEPPKPVDYDAVVQKLAEQQPRRMLLADPIFEES